MENNNNDLFEFIGDDLYSSAEAAEQNYEDILSDSSLSGRHFAKKKGATDLQSGGAGAKNGRKPL